MASAPLLTVVICTYNREALLGHCLASLAGQGAAIDWELLVVDNNSPDGTAARTDAFFAAHPALRGRRIFEPRQGLSHARNRGYREAAADWVLYLDDDAKAREDFIDRAAWLVRHGGYRIVGGVYLPWYHFGRPHWYRDRYASNALPQRTTLCAPGGTYIATGGVMLWEKALLDRLGGFDPRVGMTGERMAYGEETYLQETAKRQGVAVGYDPELVIYHVVMAQKLHPDWFFRANFAIGRDAVIGGLISPRPLSLAGQFLTGLLVLAKDLLVYTPQLLGPDYYRQNWLVDVFRKFAKRLGSVYTGLLLTADNAPPAP